MKEELQVLIKNHYKAVFKLLTCIDLYMFTLRLSASLSNKKLEVNRKCLELIDKLNKLSESYIATDMNHLLKDHTYAKKIHNDPFPIETIINKCFGDFVDGKNLASNFIVTDIYGVDFEMKYMCDRYDEFSEILRYRKQTNDKGIVDEFTDTTEIRKFNMNLYEKRKLQSLEYLRFIAQKYTNDLSIGIPS
jgi:hypothetical protein